jgi:Endonuclease NucS
MAVSADQRQSIRSLLAEGLDNQAIATQIGVSPGQVAAVKAHMTMGTYGGDGAPEAEAEVASAVDTAFGLERDLQLALRRNIEQLEPGLAIIDGDREQTVPSGRIDITARDQAGTTVVIELKAGSADRDAIGQILSYVGDLADREKDVRAILVAREFSARAVAAGKAAPNIRLVQYGFRVHL